MKGTAVLKKWWEVAYMGKLVLGTVLGTIPENSVQIAGSQAVLVPRRLLVSLMTLR